MPGLTVPYLEFFTKKEKSWRKATKIFDAFLFFFVQLGCLLTISSVHRDLRPLPLPPPSALPRRPAPPRSLPRMRHRLRRRCCTPAPLLISAAINIKPTFADAFSNLASAYKVGERAFRWDGMYDTQGASLRGRHPHATVAQVEQNVKRTEVL